MNLEHLKTKVINDPFYSIRRFYVDLFFFENLNIKNEYTKVLDIGGKSKGKRGVFDIDKIFNSVINVNINPSSAPEILADANYLPICSNNYDIVICSEFFEHVRDIKNILDEAYRVMKPGGKIFITVPFMFEIHADPYDFARYTDHYLNICLNECNFDVVSIKPQGNIYGVSAHLLKFWYKEKLKSDPHFQGKKILFFLLKIVTKCLLTKDLNYHKSDIEIENFKKITLGFEIIAIKRYLTS